MTEHHTGTRDQRISRGQAGALLRLEEAKHWIEQGNFHRAATVLGALTDYVRDTAWLKTDVVAGVSMFMPEGAKQETTKDKLSGTCLTSRRFEHNRLVVHQGDTRHAD